MLPSASRLRRRSDFGRVYGKGRSYVTDLVVVYVLPNRGSGTRVGFSASKKLGKSVIRNRTKRLMRESVRALLGDMAPGYDVVVVARRRVLEAGVPVITAAMRQLFVKSGVMRREDSQQT